MACSTGCPTQNHESYGACLRAKRLQIESEEAHAFLVHQRQGQDEYRKAREAGLQPQSNSLEDVRDAYVMSDALGKPFRADEI